MVTGNAFRSTLEAGEPVFGARAASYSPSLIEVYGALGLDFVRVDLERPGPSPWDSEYLEQAVRTAHLADVELLVRLPNSDPDLVRRVLDTGVRNLLLPRVETAAEVRRAVKAARFSYGEEPGERSFSGWRATNYSTDVDPSAVDDTVCVGVMIETAAAVENAADLLAVPGLGFLFTGPNDLSVQYGVPGQRDHPDVRAALDRVETIAREQGVPLGAAGHDPAVAIDLLDEGYQVIRLLDEFDAVRSAYATRWDRVREHI